jgi:hypothetical protein
MRIGTHHRTSPLPIKSIKGYQSLTSLYPLPHRLSLSIVALQPSQNPTDLALIVLDILALPLIHLTIPVPESRVKPLQEELHSPSQISPDLTLHFETPVPRNQFVETGIEVLELLLNALLIRRRQSFNNRSAVHTASGRRPRRFGRVLHVQEVVGAVFPAVGVRGLGFLLPSVEFRLCGPAYKGSEVGGANCALDDADVVGKEDALRCFELEQRAGARVEVGEQGFDCIAAELGSK